jgi:hypothetical protein
VRLERWTSPLAMIVASVVALGGPAVAFDDTDFCVAVKQLAAAADGDVGVWVDRKTRNAGVAVACDRKLVEFRRFTYSPSSSLDGAWKAGKAAEWNGTYCASPLWAQAIRNNWKIALSVTAVDGGHVLLHAECK